jgi:hypothetical protein
MDVFHLEGHYRFIDRKEKYLLDCKSLLLTGSFFTSQKHRHPCIKLEG